jgi:small-conductance mechanosensitive channel
MDFSARGACLNRVPCLPPALASLLSALLFASSCFAQPELTGTANAVDADTRASAEKILESVDTVSVWREQLLQRFASAPVDELEPLRRALDQLIARRNSPVRGFSYGAYPALPADISAALEIVEHRRKLNIELDILRDAVDHPADSAIAAGEPQTLGEALSRVARMERKLDLRRARAELEAARRARTEDDAFLESAATELETTAGQIARWKAITAEQPEPLDVEVWTGLNALPELQRAAAKLRQRLGQDIAAVSLRIAMATPDPLAGHAELDEIEPAVDALERAYVRADRRLTVIADNPEQITRDGGDGGLTKLRSALRLIDQDEAALRWLTEAEQARWEATTPLLRRLFTDLGSGWLSLRSGVLAVLDYSLFEVGEASVTLGGALRVLGILLAAWFTSKWLRRGLERYGKRRPDVSRPALYAAGRVLHYLLIAIGISFALSSIGLDLTKIAFFASALGVGIGFGLQGVVNNFFSGLILLFERSLKIGDFVELESGVTGEVTDISIRATRVTTNDNIDILVPNSEFVNGRVTSWTLRETARRIKVKFGVAYGSDKELVKKAALEAAAEVPFTFASEGPRRSQVWLVNFGDSSLDFELVVWLTADAVKRPGAVQAAYYWALEDALGKYGIEIPFPQRDLHLRSLFSATEQDARELWRGQKKKSSRGKPEQTISDTEREELSGNDALRDALSDLPESKKS